MTWTDDRAVQARELLAAATPRPWREERLNDGFVTEISEILGVKGRGLSGETTIPVICEAKFRPDAVFLAAAPDLLESALAEIGRLAGERDHAVAECDRLRARVADMERFDWDSAWTVVAERDARIATLEAALRQIAMTGTDMAAAMGGGDAACSSFYRGQLFGAIRTATAALAGKGPGE